MKTVDEMIDDILRREGGYVDDPKDRGGATNLGVSLRYMRGIGLDLDGDGDVDKDDVCLVTPELARELYRRDFLEIPRLDRLPLELQPQLFDISVNSGPHRAVELLQRTCNSIASKGTELIVDGRMGPQTRKAAELVVRVLGWRLTNNRLVDERVAFFKRIVDRDPRQERFLKGWLRRAEEFRV